MNIFFNCEESQYSNEMMFISKQKLFSNLALIIVLIHGIIVYLKHVVVNGAKQEKIISFCGKKKLSLYSLFPRISPDVCL